MKKDDFANVSRYYYQLERSNTKYVVFISPIPAANWSIAVALPVSVLFAEQQSLIDQILYIPKLQLQVEHLGKMATTSSSIKTVEKFIEKFFRRPIAKPLARTTIQFIGKMQHIGRTIVFNRNAFRDILA